MKYGQENPNVQEDCYCFLKNISPIILSSFSQRKYNGVILTHKNRCYIFKIVIYFNVPKYKTYTHVFLPIVLHPPDATFYTSCNTNITIVKSFQIIGVRAQNFYRCCHFLPEKSCEKFFSRNCGGRTAKRGRVNMSTIHLLSKARVFVISYSVIYKQWLLKISLTNEYMFNHIVFLLLCVGISN